MSLSLIYRGASGFERMPLLNVSRALIEQQREKFPDLKAIPLYHADGEVWPEPLPGMILECSEDAA